MKIAQSGLLTILAVGLSVSCAGSAPAGCGSDRNCNQSLGEICVQHQCVSQEEPKEATPQKIFDAWGSVLAKNDLQASKEYWSPGFRDKYQRWVTDPDRLALRGVIPSGLNTSEVLPYIARQIQGATLIPVAVKGDYQEYRLEKSCADDDDCPRQSPCVNSHCQIEQKILFDRLYNMVNNTYVLRIRSF